MDMTLLSDARAHHDEDPRSGTAAVSYDRPAKVAPRVAAPLGSGWYHDAAIEAARQDGIEARCNPYGSTRA